MSTIPGIPVARPENVSFVRLGCAKVFGPSRRREEGVRKTGRKPPTRDSPSLAFLEDEDLPIKAFRFVMIIVKMKGLDEFCEGKDAILEIEKQVFLRKRS